MSEVLWHEQKSDPADLPRPVRKAFAWVGLVVMVGGLVVAVGNVLWETKAHADAEASDQRVLREKVEGVESSIRVRIDGLQKNMDDLAKRGGRIEDKLDRLIERR